MYGTVAPDGSGLMIRSDCQIRNSTLAVGVALTLTVLLGWSLNWLERTEAGLYDARAQRFQHFTPKPTDKIVHVDIDDATLEAVGAWPWPRTQMAQIIDEMALAGAKAIVLDILYTEPQEVQYRRSADGKSFDSIDHDANLAASFERAGNVLLPASLSFVSARAQSAATTAAVNLLSVNPELSATALGEQLRSQNRFPESELSEVESIFYTLRREAVLQRVADELPKTLAAATTQPTTGPASQPATAATRITEEQGIDIRRRLMARLFPSVNPEVASPQLRLVDEAYNHALAQSSLARFTIPTPPGVRAFAPRSEIVPVARLIAAAAASGYVDYPNFGDGTVRSVPMLMQHRQQLIAQMGLRTACMMLEVDPKDLTITQHAITIPAGTLADGTPRARRVIPLRTDVHEFSSGRDIEMPLMMDIPWFGPGRWWAMYDPDRPNQKAQHLSMAMLYGTASVAAKLNRGVATLDRAAQDLLTLLGRLAPDKAGLLQQYQQRRIAGVDASADAETAAWVVRESEALGITPDLSVDDPANSDSDRMAIGAVRALAHGPADIQKLQSQLVQDRAELKKHLSGKAAIVGWTAVAAVADQKPTSLHAAAPGVVVHGVIVNAILTGDFWQTVPAWVNALLILLMGIATTAAVARLSPVQSLVIAVLLAAGYVLVNCILLFDYGNRIVDLAAPLLAVAGPWAGGTITRLVIETREKLRITRRLGSYVDPDLVGYVLESKDETIFSGQRRQTTVVFTDLEGFTRLSDKMKEAVIPILNEFMGRATVVIKKHKGFVNKFLGDGILFFFNAPKPNQSFVGDAMDSILDLQVMMKQFNAELAARDLPQLRLRVGMTTGNVIAGDAGSKERADYTVLGDYVNLAARLESANKAFGTLMLVDDTSRKSAGDRFLFRPIGLIQVVGLEEDVMTHEPLAWLQDATEEQKKLARLTTAVYDAFTAGDAAACLQAADAMDAEFNPTKLTAVYRRMCQRVLSGEDGALPKHIVLSEK